MEPPAKRTKVGRAPHDAPTDDNVNNENKMNGNKGKKSSNGAASKGSKGDYEDDEIAMDPEDYAMKVDPEYRLDRNRANADNKLKSAFELLFEKYSQDFGDTGDEINFYTDEIEVDNGHIASLPVERPSKQGDQGSDEESDEDGGGESDKLPAMSAAAKAASSRLVASLLPSRFGPGGTVIMGGGPSAAQGLAPGEIDPNWAAPELPNTAFTTPGGVFPFIPPPPPPPPRALYVAPQPTVFTKALPTSYAGDIGEDGEDEEDDLIMDAPNPATTRKSTAENNSPSGASTKPSEAQGTKKRRKKASSGPSTADSATATTTKRTVVPDSQSSGLALSEVQSSAPLPVSFDEEAPQDGPSSPPAQGNLPTPPDGDGESGVERASKESAKPKETFKRNTVDPSFVFSDEEDFGLMKKKRPQPKPSAPALPAFEPQEEPPVLPEEDAEAAIVLEVTELPLEAPIVERKEQKRRGRPRKSGGTAEVAATTKDATEVTKFYNLPEAQRREAQSLSVIIVTSSRPSSALSTPAIITTEAEVVATAENAPTVAVPAKVENVSEPETEPEVGAVPEPQPEPEAEIEAEIEAEPESEPTTAPIVEPVGEPTAEPDSEPEDEPQDELVVEPELETERDLDMDDSAYAPSPPKEASEERPKKRKRRQQTEEDQSSPMPASQRSSKSAKSLKSPQKSKTRRRRTREIPDSQSIGSSGIISLVSDGSADEAEIEKIAEASPRPFVPGSGGRRPVSASMSASGSGSRRGSPQTTPTSRNRDQTTPSSRRRLTAAEALMATPSRHGSHNKSGRLTPTASRLLLLSPLARRHQQMSGTSSAASSPGGSPVQTPGGTMRRCGKDGFRCEREFCFRCT